MNNNGQRLSSNLLCPRIDTSTPKSFYCSPKSCHYIPFSQRKYQSENIKRRSNDKNCQNRLWNQILKQRDPYLIAKQDTSNNDSSISSASSKAGFTDTNYTDRSLRSINNQQLQNQKQSKSKILSHMASCICDNGDEEMREKLDQFKDEILDDIIRRGVYTDGVIQDCISRSVTKNSTLTMAKLQQAVSELLIDIGVPNVELNKKTWITSSKHAYEEVLNYENKEFESDEGEFLSMIPLSMESNSDKLAKEDESSVSNFGLTSITDSLITINNFSVADISN
ncbi:Transcriptional regulatory protein [Dirofilaria immitis]